MTEPAAKYLIVNADDFGLSEGVNRGILEAAERGILTSASLMVRQPAAAAAAECARQAPALSIGLHLDFGEWVLRDGEWVLLYSVVSTEDATEVANETSRQLAEFQRLMGRPPTHIDSHQHVHRQEPARSIVLALARSIGVPVRDFTPEIRYCGDFYGQDGEGLPIPGALTCDGLKRILSERPPGVTELGCHPGYGEGLATPYRAERALELAVLCAPEIRDALRELRIRLCSFGKFSQGFRLPK